MTTDACGRPFAATVALFAEKRCVSLFRLVRFCVLLSYQRSFPLTLHTIISGVGHVLRNTVRTRCLVPLYTCIAFVCLVGGRPFAATDAMFK